MTDALGHGTLVSGGSVRGTATRVKDVDDVVGLLDGSDLGDVILLTESASATTIMPLLAEVAGVVCTVGGPTSHLATVARDFGLTCVVGASSMPLDEVDGRRIAVQDDGTVVAADG